MRHPLLCLALLAACGRGDKSTPAPAPSPTPDAAPAAAVDAAAPDAIAAAPGAACPPADLAVAGACEDGGRCVQLYQIDAACTVQLRKELALTYVIAELIDLAWPVRGGPLYVLVQ